MADDDRSFGAMAIGTLTTNEIILGKWIITAGDDGLYVKTPSGVTTKIELIDFSQVPVPPTANLRVEPNQVSVDLPATSQTAY